MDECQLKMNEFGFNRFKVESIKTYSNKFKNMTTTIGEKPGYCTFQQIINKK